MPRPKSYFGDADELREIQERRNEEIRAWGRKQLEDADAVLLGVPTEPFPVSDWDQIAEEATGNQIAEEDITVSETPQLSPIEAVVREEILPSGVEKQAGAPIREEIVPSEVPKATPRARPKPKAE